MRPAVLVYSFFWQTWKVMKLSNTTHLHFVLRASIKKKGTSDFFQLIFHISLYIPGIDTTEGETNKKIVLFFFLILILD